MLTIIFRQLLVNFSKRILIVSKLLNKSKYLLPLSNIDNIIQKWFLKIET